MKSAWVKKSLMQASSRPARVLVVLLIACLASPAGAFARPAAAGPASAPRQAGMHWALVNEFSQVENCNSSSATLTTQCVVTRSGAHIEWEQRSSVDGRVLASAVYDYVWKPPPGDLDPDYYQSDARQIQLNIHRFVTQASESWPAPETKLEFLLGNSLQKSLHMPSGTRTDTLDGLTRLNDFPDMPGGSNPLSNSTANPNELNLKFIAGLYSYSDSPKVVFTFQYRLEALSGASAGASSGGSPPGCTQLHAGEVTWVTLTAGRQVDQQVQSYPSGTTQIVPSFDYDCVPANTELTVVLNRDGKTVLNARVSLPADPGAGTYRLPIQGKNKTALADGHYTIQFYNHKALVTSGETSLGGGPGAAGPGSDWVSVQGVVLDAKTRNPLPGASIFVLAPGYRAQAWFDQDMPDAWIYASGSTGRDGRFNLFDPVYGQDEPRLKRKVTYALIVYAQGYRTLMKEDFVLGSSAPDPAYLTITLVK